MVLQQKKVSLVLCVVFVIVALVAVYLIGQFQRQRKTDVAMVGAPQEEQAKLGELVSTDTIVMGIVPAEDLTIALERQRPLTEYLTRELGRPIKSFTATDYTGIVEAMRAGKIHIAWFGPFSYVMAAQRANAVPLAVAIHEGGRTAYRSYIVTNPEIRDILGIATPLEGVEGARELFRKLEPHKRKFTFTFSDPESTLGFVVPRYVLHKVTDGQTPEEWFRIVGYVGTHDAAMLVVKNDIIDIATVYDKRFHEMTKSGQISPETNVIIYKSEPIVLGSLLAYRRDLPQDIVGKLTSAMKNMPREVASTQGATYQGYKIVTEEDFRVIFEIKEFFGLCSDDTKFRSRK